MTVWLVSAIVLLPPNLIGVVVHDEGIIASGALLVAHGRYPYSDFLAFYGPAQYYVLAGLLRVFGEDLVVLRLLHVAWQALLIVAVWAVSRRIAGPTRAAPVVGALTTLAIAVYAKHNAGYPAMPAAAFLLLAGLPLATWTGRNDRALLVASALVALAGLFRWDFGVFGLVALSLTVVFMAVWVRRAPPRALARSLLYAGLPALLILAIIYGPLLVIAGPRQWYQNIVAYALFEFPKLRAEEFIRPAYWMGLRAIETGDAFAVVDAVTRLGYYVAAPPLLALAALAMNIRRGAGLSPQSLSRDETRATVVYLALLACVLLQQMRVRPHVWQGFPAVAAAMPLMVYVWTRAEWLRGTRTGRVVSSAVAAVGISIAILAAVPHAREVLRPDLVALDEDRARFIRVRPEHASYGTLLRDLRARTLPDDPLYSGAADHSRLYICDSLVYFLAGRFPADPFMELEPGIANTPEGQRQIVEALAAKRVPVIVLLDWVSKEANLSTQSNGVVIVDDFIRTHYTPAARFGAYTVLRRLE